MIGICMGKETGEKTGRGKRKRRGIAAYLKSSLFGCGLAFISFSTALAMQPSLSGDAVERTATEATMEDLEILRESMIQSEVKELEKECGSAGEVICRYAELHPEFLEVSNDYFGN